MLQEIKNENDIKAFKMILNIACIIAFPFLIAFPVDDFIMSSQELISF